MSFCTLDADVVSLQVDKSRRQPEIDRHITGLCSREGRGRVTCQGKGRIVFSRIDKNSNLAPVTSSNSLSARIAARKDTPTTADLPSSSPLVISSCTSLNAHQNFGQVIITYCLRRPSPVECLPCYSSARAHLALKFRDAAQITLTMLSAKIRIQRTRSNRAVDEGLEAVLAMLCTIFALSYYLVLSRITGLKRLNKTE